MSCVLRLEALQQLAACIGEEIPELDGRICVGPAEHPTKLKFPNLSIVPVTYTFHPDQDGDVFAVEGDQTILLVGRHEALVQLRLGEKTALKRYELEHRVSAIFEGGRRIDPSLTPNFSDGYIRPGVLTLPVPQCFGATVAFELERTEWRNELAFDKEWYSIVAVTAQIPSLVNRFNIPTIEEIRSSFTEDVERAFADLPASAIETVIVAEDGGISPAP